jgi:GMP synthase-like glutamine amidotransferase
MLYIIQNDGEVPAGIVEDELQRLGVERRHVRLHNGEALPELSADSALVVLGGAMGANDDEHYPFLTSLKRFIAQAMERDIPYLGICLGGQLLSLATGGELASGSSGEKGSYSIMLTDEGRGDRLFHGMGHVFISFQWHDDSFSIPPDGTRLAFTGTCHNQAFRVGKRAWGLQFHPEVNREIVVEWSSWSPESAARTGEYVAAFQEWEEEYLLAGRQLVENFVRIAGLLPVPYRSV